MSKKGAVIAWAATVFVALAQAQTIGMHLGTVHERDGFNGENPGLYVMLDNGITAGSYFNSERRQSNYVGYTWQGETFGLSAVALTGYRPDPVLAPIPSARFRIGPAYGRGFLLWSPWGGAALHFSIEYTFGGKP